MRLTARGFLAGPWFGAIFSLLTLGSVVPSTARAGCLAHYIAFRSPSAESLGQLEQLSLHGALATPEDNAPPERPAPCTGALCSGNPALPVSTVPSVLTSGADQWAIPAFPVALTDPHSIVLTPADASLFPIDGPSAIFHPPR